MNGITKFIKFLLPLWSIISEIFDFKEISENREKFKTALEQLREKFGEVKITSENIEKFFEVAELTKEMGGLDALHEALSEAKASGMLDDLTRIFDEKPVEKPIEKPVEVVRATETPSVNWRKRIAEVALAEVGQRESPQNSNRTKYGEWFGWNGVAWCGIFVSWVYAMAKKPLPNIGFAKGFAGCMTAVDYFRKNGKITTDPKEGDIVFFDWNADGRYDHTGIFLKWVSSDRSMFETVEGNTSATNQSNGGEVQKRVRNAQSNYKVVFASVE